MKTKGIYFLYRILQLFALPVLVLYFLSRGLRNRGYWRSLRERFGFLPRSFRQTGPGAIWLHAVSVGEILSCIGFLRRLRAALPHSRIFVSTTTLAGRATADDKLRGLADGVFYAPADYVFAVRRVLRDLRPSVVVIAETEIWPNLFREVKRTGAGLAVVNARISDRALTRYLRFQWLFRAVLPCADTILAQTGAIRDRFSAIGAPPGKVETAGNFKYDFEARPAAPDSPVAAFLERVRPSHVWIAASTMPPDTAGDVDEDDAVIAAFRDIAPRHPGLLLILVPRKPERFDSVAQKLDSAGISYARRSAGLPEEPRQVLLLDTIGELSGLFAFADVVFMGGTLARRGGHNILEPALFGKPVVIGPHMENFQAIADEFRAADACVGIESPAALADSVERLLLDREAAREIGRRALACAEARRGATARAVAAVCELHAGHLPHYRPAQPGYAIRRALSWVWIWGGNVKRARDLRRQKRLDVPVISVGNLSMGGTGKTPCVLRVAELLKERGRAPGILTRGYARGSPEKQLVIAPGASVRAEYSGDEPQIFVRAGVGPVGIGADRYRAGALLRREFHVDALVLDDGFQHVRLARDVDIVLIDALHPFAGGEVFPLGRLREPFEGLSRASLFVITRSDFSDLPCGIERFVRRYNPRAPIFRATIRTEAWIDHRTGQRHGPDHPPFRRAGAFCGLGNPQSFFRTVDALGVEPAGRVEFPDHHRYRPHELRRLAQQFHQAGATALVTTEKDVMNLCEGCDDLFAPLTLYWLRVSIGIEREQDFLAEIERRIS